MEPKSVGQRLPQSVGHLAKLLRLTVSPFCRLQVHLPLPLSCARLPGLLRAPRPGLGSRTGKGHERGELGVGVGGVWAGRGPGARQPSLRGGTRRRTQRTSQLPISRHQGVHFCLWVCQELTPRKHHGPQAIGREVAPWHATRALLTPRFRP